MSVADWPLSYYAIKTPTYRAVCVRVITPSTSVVAMLSGNCPLSVYVVGFGLVTGIAISRAQTKEAACRLVVC